MLPARQQRVLTSAGWPAGRCMRRCHGNCRCSSGISVVLRIDSWRRRRRRRCRLVFWSRLIAIISRVCRSVTDNTDRLLVVLTDFSRLSSCVVGRMYGGSGRSNLPPGWYVSYLTVQRWGTSPRPLPPSHACCTRQRFFATLQRTVGQSRIEEVGKSTSLSLSFPSLPPFFFLFFPIPSSLPFPLFFLPLWSRPLKYS